MSRLDTKLLWDAHAHRNATDPAALQSQLRNPEAAVFLGGIDPDDWNSQIELKRQFPEQIKTSFGLHPWFIHNASSESREQAWLQLQAMLDDADALGECGLDYAAAKTDAARELQKYWCQRQVQLAISKSKPLVLHVVRAHDDMLALLTQHARYRGLVHAFSGDDKLGARYLSKGFLLSLGQRIAPSHLRAILTKLPAPSWVLESDDKGSSALWEMADRCAQILQTAAQTLLEQQGEKLQILFAKD